MTSYILRNKTGCEAEILDYGAVIRRLCVPDDRGKAVNVVLGFADAEAYLDNPCYMGAAIGPVCGRTKGASFALDGGTWHIPQNEGANNLHGDSERGFHKRIWEVADVAESHIVLRLHAPHLDLGFPGERSFTLTYTLTDDNALRIDYHVTSDRPAFVNPTQHTYFNLDGEGGGSILRHRARFAASRFLPLHADMTLTGEICEAKGTPFDFSAEKEIGAAIGEADAQLIAASGYDHFFLADGADHTLRPLAWFTSPDGHLRMEVSSTLPGFQFYTGNFFSCEKDCAGKKRGAREAFCVETSFPPDAFRVPAFPKPCCDAAHPFSSTTICRFS